MTSMNHHKVLEGISRKGLTGRADDIRHTVIFLHEILDEHVGAVLLIVHTRGAEIEFANE